eukprot:620276_1
MNYCGTYKWHVDDTRLIKKILSAKLGDKLESDEVFQVGKLNWKLELYPTGWDKDTKGFCNVCVKLLAMPASWKCIFCQLHIECPQIQAKMVRSYPYKYNKPHSSGCFLSSFGDLRASCGKELTFIITIRIARITLKQDNKILFQMQTNKYKNNTRLQWKIDEETMKTLKTFDKGKGIFSGIYNNIWCLQLYPNGCWDTVEGDVDIGLWLCGLPPNVSKLKVEWTVHCREANIKQTWTNDFDEDHRYYSWQQNTISFAEFCKHDTWTVRANINVSNEFDMNGKDLTDSVWNEHKEPQNDESTQPNEVSAFLSDLRLNQYIAAFTENGFETMHELKQLTNDDLKELGVLKMAHRKQIKNGISAHSTA